MDNSPEGCHTQFKRPRQNFDKCILPTTNESIILRRLERVIAQLDLIQECIDHLAGQFIPEQSQEDTEEDRYKE